MLINILCLSVYEIVLLVVCISHYIRYPMKLLGILKIKVTLAYKLRITLFEMR